MSPRPSHASRLLLLPLLCLAGCTKFQLLNALVPPCSYTKTSDVQFGPRPGQTLDVYRPTHPDAGHGVVVFFYGGDWQRGTKDEYAFVGQAFASRGFVTVLPNYREYPAVTFPTFVEDAALAVRWTHDHAAAFGGDAQRIYLSGHSAGGHIAVLVTMDGHYLHDVGLDRSDIRATAGLSGPYDFVPPPDDHRAFGMSPGDTHPSPAIEPVHFADGHAPPMLLVQGDLDTTVDPANATHLAAAIRAAGGTVEVKRYPNRAHVGIVLSLAFPFRWLDPVLDDVSNYFKRH